jgi:hypothetical protein
MQVDSHAQLWDVAEAGYFASDRLSSSGIELFRKDRRDFVEHIIQRRPRVATEEMSLGKYVHGLVLEPDTVVHRFATAPSRSDLDPSLFGTDEGAKLVKRNTKEGKAAYAQFVAEAGDRTILLPEQSILGARMLRALFEHPTASDLLFADDDGHNEQALLWRDDQTGRLLRARLDRLLLERGLIVELKTDQDCDPTKSRNRWRWREWGYHRKAAFYLDGAYAATGRNHTFKYVFVENTSRPRVSVYTLETDSPCVEQGREEYGQTILDIEACERAGDWREPWEIGEQPFPLEGHFGGEPLTITMGGVALEGM